MAESTADVKRDIELTRERMSSTIEELEHRLNVVQLVRDHPWPALAVAVGAGVALSRSGADVKAAAATAAATSGTRSKISTALDDVVATLVSAARDAVQGRVDEMVSEVQAMIGGAHVRRPDREAGYGVGPVDVTERGPTPLGQVRRAD